MDPALRRLTRELQSCSVDGVSLQIDDSDLRNLVALIDGPDETPYAAGKFRIRCHFGPEWPVSPPKCWFETNIFHPNVSVKGEICVNTLKKDWQTSHTISHILATIKCLLIYPNPESALNEEAGKLLLEHYDDFARVATLMTSVHARQNSSGNNSGENEPHSSSISANSIQNIPLIPLQPSAAMNSTGQRKSLLISGSSVALKPTVRLDRNGPKSKEATQKKSLKRL